MLVVVHYALGFAPSAVPAGAAVRAAPAMAAIDDLPGASIEVGGKPFDPLGLGDMAPYGSSQFEWMRTAEIKHGRSAMAACVGYLLVEAGVHFPGYLSTSAGLKFADLSSNGVEAWSQVPMAGKAQILAACGVVELFTEVKKPHYLNAGMPTWTEIGRAHV